MRFRPLLVVLPLLLLWFGGLAIPGIASPARIKDLVEVDGVRGNDLLGYGLVVGLNNTGDSLRNSPFTEDAIVNLLERLGVNVTGEQIRARNVAAVLVTASLPPFARAGSQVDVTVSAIGDARSLLGGTLVMTPLNAADGQIYDTDRIMFLRNCLTHLQRATAEGVPVKGYFEWSLMDNLEWNAGFGNRFGIVYVDFKTQKRTPKISASWFREAARRNAVV